MAGTVEFFQIIWKEEQKANLFPFSIPYFNESLTPFFENTVISKLVKETTADKIGVGSPELYKKIGSNVPLARPFEQKHLDSDYDVLSLNRRQRDHKMLWLLDYWHKGSRLTLEMIMQKVGVSVVEVPKHPIYSNYFVARADIYKEYVTTVLDPAMDLMENDLEIRSRCYEDSQYYKLTHNPEFKERVKRYMGLDYCPLHTFLCERMFTLFINSKKLDVKYLPEIV